LEIPSFKIFYETSFQYRINYTISTLKYNYVLVDGLEDYSELKVTHFRHQTSALYLQQGRYLRVNRNFYSGDDLRGKPATHDLSQTIQALDNIQTKSVAVIQQTCILNIP